jgi:hypothetical protein
MRLVITQDCEVLVDGLGFTCHGLGTLSNYAASLRIEVWPVDECSQMFWGTGNQLEIRSFRV